MGASRELVAGAWALLTAAAALVLASLLAWAAIGHVEWVETALYAAAFVAVLPLSVAVGRRRARAGATIPAVRGVVVAGVGVGAGLALLALPENLLAPGALAVSLAIAGALMGIYLGFERILARAGGTRVIDAAVVLLLLLVITDVSVQSHPSIAGDPFVLSVFRYHQHNYLGPTNDVLNGALPLVDSFSWYGVGVFYFLAGWFQLAPLGYATLGILTSGLLAVQHGVAYAALRAAGCGAPIATIGIALAAVAGVLAGAVTPAFVPTAGALRYGLAYLLVLAAVLERRAGQRSSRWRWVQAGILGLASIWSLEAFASTAAVFGAGSALGAVIDETDPRARGRHFARSVLRGLGGCVAAHLLFLLVSLVATADLPDWPGYASLVRAYARGDEAWPLLLDPRSPGLLLGALLFASAIGLLITATIRLDLVRARPAHFTAIGTFNALGVVNFSYFVGRSADSALPYLLLPPIALVCLWCSLGLRRDRGPRYVALAATFAALWCSALMILHSSGNIESAWSRTPFAQIAPGAGGGSFGDSLDRAWHERPLEDAAGDGAALIETLFPPGTRVLALANPQTGQESLIRANRSNLLPSSDPAQDRITPGWLRPRFVRVIDAVRPGTLMLADQRGLASGAGLLPLQREMLKRLRTRFTIREVRTAPSGPTVVRLVGRRDVRR